MLGSSPGLLSSPLRGRWLGGLLGRSRCRWSGGGGAGRSARGFGVFAWGVRALGMRVSLNCFNMFYRLFIGCLGQCLLGCGMPSTICIYMHVLEGIVVDSNWILGCSLLRFRLFIQALVF